MNLTTYQDSFSQVKVFKNVFLFLEDFVDHRPYYNLSG
jgi:hypothetical protein